MKYSIIFIIAMVAVLKFDSAESKPFLFPFFFGVSKQIVVPTVRFTPVPITYSYYRVPLLYPVIAAPAVTVEKVYTSTVEQPPPTKTVVKTKSVSTITSDSSADKSEEE